MALPSVNDLKLWAGNLFTNTQWDSNFTKVVQFLTSGTYDLNIANLTCADITANSINVSISNGVPTGQVIQMATTYSPTGFLRCNGANQTITSYPDLFKTLGHTYGAGDGTPVASSGVSVAGNVCTVTSALHGLANGSYVSVKFTDVASSVVINRGTVIENVSANTFDFSVVGWQELPVSPLEFTPATTFPVPDTRGYVARDLGNVAIDPDVATRTNRGDGTVGDQVGTKQEDQFKSHTHSRGDSGGSGGGSSSYGRSFGTWYTGATGGNQTNTVNIGLTFYIKT
tara:strand:- start:7947 stop:8801 length:855 start_codon:yes stop_codon:yes gene_type:complete